MKKNWEPMIKEMNRLIGYKETRKLLVLEGFGTSTADRLARKIYPSEVKDLARAALERALAVARLRAS